MNRNGFFKTKSFRYGSTATAFTAAFIAFVLVFNIIFTALANRYMWYIDMTNEEIFTLCDATKELLADVDEEINIYFAASLIAWCYLMRLRRRTPMCLMCYCRCWMMVA